MKKISVVIGDGEAGLYIAINGNRIAGSKPIGPIRREWQIDPEIIRKALPAPPEAQGADKVEGGLGGLDCYDRPLSVQIAEGCKCFASGQILMTADCPVHGEAEDDKECDGVVPRDQFAGVSKMEASPAHSDREELTAAEEDAYHEKMSGPSVRVLGLMSDALEQYHRWEGAEAYAPGSSDAVDRWHIMTDTYAKLVALIRVRPQTAPTIGFVHQLIPNSIKSAMGELRQEVNKGIPGYDDDNCLTTILGKVDVVISRMTENGWEIDIQPPNNPNTKGAA